MKKKIAGFTDEGKWYKGNLHSHTVNSDGNWTPQEAVKKYKAMDYHFLCFSEHDLYTDYRGEFDSEDFIILPGLEASVELWDEQGITRKKVHHIHGILGTQQMQASAKNILSEHGKHREVKKYYGSWNGAAAAQKLVDELRAQGMFTTYNHPVWSRVEMEEFIHTQGLWAVEIFNYGTEDECAAGYDETCWDIMLRQGNMIPAFASDDNHNGAVQDSFGGFVMVKAPELSHEAIVSNLLSGNYYSSAGPEIYDWGIDNGTVYVRCSPVYRIDFIAGNFVGAGISHISEGHMNGLDYGTYHLTGQEAYVRVRCTDKYGRSAWTNALQLSF